MFEHAFAAGAIDGQPLEAGNELFRFALPVGQHRGGHHNKVWPVMVHINHVLDKGQGLHGFAKAHFVGKNTAEPVFRKEVEVRKPLHLIAAQVGVERLGRRDGPHLAERADFFAQVVPEGVRGCTGQVFQQAVEHWGFKLLELLLRGL